MTTRYREEVFNVLLADLLAKRGVASIPEQVVRDYPREGRWLPDVWVDYEGLTVAVEGKVENDAVLDQARARVEDGRAHMAIAVIYPSHLQGVPTLEALKEELGKATLRIAVVTEAGETGFVAGDLGYLGDFLRRTHEDLVKEDIVEAVVKEIKGVVSQLTNFILRYPAVYARLAKRLEMKAEKAAREKEPERVNRATAGIASLIIFNGVFFHEVLGAHDERVTSFADFPEKGDIQMKMLDDWAYIIEKINYYPIFYLSRLLLGAFAANMTLDTILKLYVRTAHELVRKKAALRHDLMGRMYHLLLEDAKYLGAYYTSVPAAVMLLKLALRPDAWKLDWARLDLIREFAVGDFACGTGTLLMAAAESITDNYVRASAVAGTEADLIALHRILIEDVVKGFDVLPEALHLTASSLTTRAPEITVDRMMLAALPLGGPRRALGSLEFLATPVIKGPDLFGSTDAPRVMGPNESAETEVNLPALDLCVMNPPFTRSVGGNLLFGSVPAAERADMQSRLKKVLGKSQCGGFVDITAGLGAPFAVVGHKALRKDGRLALVLPKTALSGVAWDKTRELFREHYQLEWVVASHDPSRWNFSENTSLSEVLVVLKRIDGAPAKSAKSTFVNLWRNPTRTFEGLAVARAILGGAAPDAHSGKGQGALKINIGNKKFGEAVSVPWPWLKERKSWMLPAAFAQNELIRIAWGLLEGRLKLPGERPRKVPIAALRDFGDLGYDRRAIHNGFEVSEGYTPYKSLWGHDSGEVTTMGVEPNKYLSPRTAPQPGLTLADAGALWGKASKFLIAERMRLNTNRLAAVMTPNKVLSNVWWNFLPKRGFAAARVLIFWLNSTLGLLLLLSQRQETAGAWISFKKTSLLELTVLDFNRINKNRLVGLSRVFDRLAKEPLLSLPYMPEDPTRAAIDKAFEKALNLPDLGPLREMLAREPVICLRPLS